MLKIFAILPTMFLKPTIISVTLPILFLLSLLNYSTNFTMTSTPCMMTNFESFNCAMISLAILITFLMIILSVKHGINLFIYSTLSLLTIVIFFFSTNNMFTLYIMFELSLIPTLILILKWGYQPERLQSSFYFMMYTITASLPLLFMIIIFYNCSFTFNFSTMHPMYLMESSYNYSITTFCFLTAFLVKLPTWGVHLWLPKAHVEAPVSGSMVLAGILLKLGGYGLMKISSLMLFINNIYFLFFSINLWGATILGFVCMIQMDIKKLIAYSSVIHMNLLTLGILTKNMIGMTGAMVMMIAHGITSPAMFTLAAFNYEKTGSRNVLLMKGIGPIQPVMMMLWFLVLATNMAAPPSINLMSEILISISVLKMSFFFASSLSMVTFMAAAYNLKLYSAQQGNPLTNTPSKLHTSAHFLPMIIQAFPCYLLILMIPIML